MRGGTARSSTSSCYFPSSELTVWGYSLHNPIHSFLLPTLNTPYSAIITTLFQFPLHSCMQSMQELGCCFFLPKKKRFFLPLSTWDKTDTPPTGHDYDDIVSVNFQITRAHLESESDNSLFLHPFFHSMILNPSIGYRQPSLSEYLFPTPVATAHRSDFSRSIWCTVEPYLPPQCWFAVRVRRLELPPSRSF